MSINAINTKKEKRNKDNIKYQLLLNYVKIS